jgi:hypothetical protein
MNIAVRWFIVDIPMNIAVRWFIDDIPMNIAADGLLLTFL